MRASAPRVALVLAGGGARGAYEAGVVRYLRDGNRPLTEVSALLGFSAQSGFSRWYRKHFHSTASSQRRAPRER